MALKQQRMVPVEGEAATVEARARWEVRKHGVLNYDDKGCGDGWSSCIMYSYIQARLASLEGRVLSLTHELEAAREGAVAAEEARAASVKEYERALAGRVSESSSGDLYVDLVLTHDGSNATTQELELRACRAKLRAYGAEIGGMKRILASAAASAGSLLPTAAGDGGSSDGGYGDGGGEEDEGLA